MTNVAETTDVRILSDDEINSVAGGNLAVLVVVGIAAGIAAGVAYNSIAESNAPGWRYTDGGRALASGGGATESGPEYRE